jgi:hypothetical protein
MEFPRHMRRAKWAFCGSGVTISPALLLIALGSCGGGSTPNTAALPNLTVQLGPENTVLTASQRATLGFEFGPPDGTLGVLLNGGAYVFFAAARSTAACTGTPSAQGTYRLGGSLREITAAYGCAQSFSLAAALTPTATPSIVTMPVAVPCLPLPAAPERLSASLEKFYSHTSLAPQPSARTRT